MNSSPGDDPDFYRERIERLVSQNPVRFAPGTWRVCSSPSTAATRRAALMERLIAAGHGIVRSLASVMTEPLGSEAFALGRESESYDPVLAKTVSLDDWPDITDKAPWIKGAKLRLFVDRKDEEGFHVIADLCPASDAQLGSPESPTVGVMVHGPVDERATAELRPNFPTRVLSPAVHTSLDNLLLTIVAA